jgi:Na+/H+-dicarboxylate symporter
VAFCRKYIRLSFWKDVAIIKPLGDIFLNLLLLQSSINLFFTIASSIASLERTEKLGKLFVVMIAVFLCTVLISGYAYDGGCFCISIHQDIIISKCLWKI